MSAEQPAPIHANSPLALLTNQQVRVADELAAHEGVQTGALMERAGVAVAQEVLRRFTHCQVVVLVGPGNNGGDGLVAARELGRAGWPVKVALLVPATALRGETAAAWQHWNGPSAAITPDCCDGAGLVIDAVFGVGCDRDIDPLLAELFDDLAERRIPVVAVDIPSGVEGNSGRLLGGAPLAALTVTFARKKPGHLLLPGRTHAGEVVVADIGIPSAVYTRLQPNLFENGPEFWQEDFPWPQSHDHKYSRGVALIAGGAEMTGAARLAARAAQRAGAGLVVLAAPLSAAGIYRLALESCIVRALADDKRDWESALAERRYDAVLVGPGLGLGESTRHKTLTALHSGLPCVVDADALGAFAACRADLLGSLQPSSVLTPHAGEFERLFDITGDSLRRASLAAVVTGSVVLLKGAASVIAAPDGTCVINANAPPDLATAGAGDVLAGILAGLLAQGMPAFRAAAAAAWLHGETARRFGPGLIAEDIVEGIPAVLHSLRLLRTPG